MKKIYLLIFLNAIVINLMAQNITLTSSPVAASNIAQGTSSDIVYIVKMDVASLPVTVNSIQVTLTGTHVATDLTLLHVYFNATAPTISGASFVAANVPATFAAPHTYNTSFNAGSKTIAAGASGYFIITVNTAAGATDGNTIKVNGAANPVTFGYTTAPTITNNQIDIAGTQTILAAGITLTSSPVAASNIAQGTSSNIVYVVKMDVASLPITVNSIQFTLTGTHVATDLTVLHVYFNATAPTISGASFVAANVPATFAAPHPYDAGFNVGSRTIAAGASGYFIITVNTAAGATDGNTIKVNGAASPVTFGYTTAPTITNNQTDIAGTQTILAAGITLTSSPVAASNIAQGTSSNIVYIVKMDVASLPVTVNSIQVTLTGTHVATDLTVLHVYFNATAPTISGASFVAANVPATFAAPHPYDAGFNVGSRTIAAGASGYFIITVNTAAAATDGNTIKVNGGANPVTFGYTTAPTITNNQTDIAGTQTILAAGIALTSSAVAASNIAQGTNNNIVYIVKMDMASLPVTINSIQFTLSGTHDNNDLSTLNVFFNASVPSLTGATQIEISGSALFAAPHSYNLPFNLIGGKTIAAGASGYFIITANVDAAATSGHTVKSDGLANPVTFGYTTAPTITNNQTDIAGTQTIGSALPLTLTGFTGNTTNAQEVQLQWITATEFNTKDFEIEWSGDGQSFSKIAVLPAAGNSSQNLHYGYLHKQPLNGDNYYRLKMIDIDSRSTYSAVIEINVVIATAEIRVFPNPVINVLQFQVQAVKNETIMFHLLSADGKIIASKSFTVIKGSNRLSWNLEQLPSGNYLISSGGNHFETIKIIKR